MVKYLNVLVNDDVSNLLRNGTKINTSFLMIHTTAIKNTDISKFASAYWEKNNNKKS